MEESTVEEKMQLLLRLIHIIYTLNSALPLINVHKVHTPLFVP